MKKLLNSQEASFLQRLEQDVVQQLTPEDLKNLKDLKKLLEVVLLVLDSLSLEIGSGDKLFLALVSVKDKIGDDPEKIEIFNKVVKFMETRRQDNVFVRGGFF